MTNKFQEKLKEAIFVMSEAEKSDLRLNLSERQYMRKRAHKRLNSLISQAVPMKALGLCHQRWQAECQMYWSLVGNHEEIIDESIHRTPQYWIDLVEKESE